MQQHVRIPEPLVEERLARLETHAEHLQSDVTELKAHVIRLDTKIDTRFDGLRARIDAVNTNLGDRIDTLRSWSIGIAIALLTASIGGTLWLSQRQDILIAEIVSKALTASPAAAISPTGPVVPRP